jgi:adenylosuccinate lyase
VHLAGSVPQFAGAKLPDTVRARAAELAHEPPADAAAAVKAIEAKINHDVKAVEYYVRRELSAAGASEATLELVHFALTSEDINNVSYARLLAHSRIVLMQGLEKVAVALTGLAHQYAELPMLARTHGQPASPTTVGKEVANFVARLRRAMQRWQSVAILGKWNGAVGNFNAHVAAAPELDWPAINRAFVESLGLQHNDYTTQIEPHDWIAEYSDAVAALDTVLIDLCRDFWGYISLGYFRQRPNAAEVGSSTMPHKVNPIDFENAEGNLGVANALLRHFADKLPISRWQRDLTDSTVLRNLGVALGHALIGWRSLERGLTKIEASPATLATDIDDAWEVLGEAVQTVLRNLGVAFGHALLAWRSALAGLLRVAPDGARMAADLDAHWEVLAEAIQTVLRAHGVTGGYEKLKDFTRGRDVGAPELRAFVATLGLPDDARRRLEALTPASYTGLAEALARAL